MKGRLLSIEEVLELKDGTKVWVEDDKNFYDSQVCMRNGNHLIFDETKDCMYNYYTIGEDVYNDVDRIKIYEWKEVVKVEERLKIELFRYENLVFGKVIHMDESLRSIGVLAQNNFGDFAIKSNRQPQLDNNNFFVKGRLEDKDSEVFNYKFESIEQAIKSCENIKVLVDKINKIEIKEEVKSGVIQVL